MENKTMTKIIHQLMNKYIAIVLILMINTLNAVHAKPSAPITIEYEAIKSVDIDENVLQNISLVPSIDIQTLSVQLSARNGLSLADSSKNQTFSNVKAGDSVFVEFNAQMEETVGYVVVTVTGTDLTGQTHVKNKVIKLGTGIIAVEKTTAVTVVNDEQIILMPAQTQ